MSLEHEPTVEIRRCEDVAVADREHEDLAEGELVGETGGEANRFGRARQNGLE